MTERQIRELRPEAMVPFGVWILRQMLVHPDKIATQAEIRDCVAGWKRGKK